MKKVKSEKMRLTRQLVWEEFGDEIEELVEAHLKLRKVAFQEKSLEEKIAFLKKEKILPPELVAEIDRIWVENAKYHFNKEKYVASIKKMKKRLKKIIVKAKK